MRIATKVSIALAAGMILVVAGSAATFLSVRSLRKLMEDVVAQNVASVRAAAQLEKALLEQRGIVGTYILDAGNPAWLEDLTPVEPDLGQWLAKARQAAHSPEAQGIVDQLAAAYQDYGRARARAFALFDSGRVEEARSLVKREVTVHGERVRKCWVGGKE